MTDMNWIASRSPRSLLRHTRAALAPALALLAMACASSAEPPDEQLSPVSRSVTALSLGTTHSFAILAGTTVTNIGPSVVTGDLGVAPGSAVTGFPPGLVAGGATHAGDAVALQAQSDVIAAYDELAGQACDENLTGQDLGGLTLTAGTYCFSSSAQLTGTLTLDAEGDPSAIFVVQIGSTLVSASNSSVRMINGGDPCNVYWQVGSSATLGTGTTFMGSIIALTSVTLTNGVSVSGRAIARNGAVTMESNRVDAASCQATPDAGTLDAGSVLADASEPVNDAAVRDAATAELPDAGGGEVVVGVDAAVALDGSIGTDAGSDAAGSGASSEKDAGVEVDAGMTTCGGGCVVDLQTNPDNCGTCGNVCAAGTWCVSGVCCGL